MEAKKINSIKYPLSFNVNDAVYVKLTDIGKKIYMKHFEQYKKLNIFAPYRNKLDDMLEFQLYNLFEIFGGENMTSWVDVNFKLNEIYFNIDINNDIVSD